MDNNQGTISCAMGCWLVALLGGVLAAALLMALGGWGFMQGVFAGAVVFAVAGALLSVILCRPLPGVGDVTAGAQADAANDSVTETEAAPAVAAAPATSPVKPSKALPGQQDLAARKGTWTYQADGGGADAADKRGADDRTQIKGVGPKLAGLLNSNGIERFEQIASWGADDVKWADENLKGFKGRASRDNWVEQAKALAKG